jgi:hypothetical protein
MDLLQKVKDSLDRRVIVSGKLSRNSKGEPIRIKLDSPNDLKVFATDLKVLPFEKLRGSDRDFTGGLKSHEFIKLVRG